MLTRNETHVARESPGLAADAMAWDTLPSHYIAGGKSDVAEDWGGGCSLEWDRTSIRVLKRLVGLSAKDWSAAHKRGDDVLASVTLRRLREHGRANDQHAAPLRGVLSSINLEVRRHYETENLIRKGDPNAMGHVPMLPDYDEQALDGERTRHRSRMSELGAERTRIVDLLLTVDREPTDLLEMLESLGAPA